MAELFKVKVKKQGELTLPARVVDRMERPKRSIAGDRFAKGQVYAIMLDDDHSLKVSGPVDGSVIVDMSDAEKAEHDQLEKHMLSDEEFMEGMRKLERSVKNRRGMAFGAFD